MSGVRVLNDEEIPDEIRARLNAQPTLPTTQPAPSLTTAQKIVRQGAPSAIGGALGGAAGLLAAPFTAGIINPITGAMAGSALGEMANQGPLASYTGAEKSNLGLGLAAGAPLLGPATRAIGMNLPGIIPGLQQGAQKVLGGLRGEALVAKFGAGKDQVDALFRNVRGLDSYPVFLDHLKGAVGGLAKEVGEFTTAGMKKMIQRGSKLAGRDDVVIPPGEAGKPVVWPGMARGLPKGTGARPGGIDATLDTVEASRVPLSQRESVGRTLEAASAQAEGKGYAGAPLGEIGRRRLAGMGGGREGVEASTRVSIDPQTDTFIDTVLSKAGPEGAKVGTTFGHLRGQLHHLGLSVRALERKGGQAYGVAKKMYGAMLDDLDETLKQVPDAKMREGYRLAIEATKRQHFGDFIKDGFRANFQSVGGTKNINFDGVVTKMEKNRDVLKRLVPETDVDAVIESVRKFAHIPVSSKIGEPGLGGILATERIAMGAGITAGANALGVDIGPATAYGVASIAAIEGISRALGSQTGRAIVSRLVDKGFAFDEILQAVAQGGRVGMTPQMPQAPR